MSVMAGVYYFNTCAVVRALKEQCRSIHTISRIVHILKVDYPITGSTSSINKCANGPFP